MPGICRSLAGEIMNPSITERQAAFAAALLAIIPEQSGRVLRDEPMADHTTFRVGGPADFFIEPATVAEIQAVLRAARDSEVPVTLLGNGSNVVVADAGIRGAVVSLGQPFAKISREGLSIQAQAGAKLSSIAAFAAREGLGGLAFASGIPGTLGGAVMMNAGAYDHCMAEIVTEVEYLDEKGELQTACGESLGFGYRISCFKDTGRIITSTRMVLSPEEPTAIWDQINTLAQRRRQSQPIELPSAGSAFKRPPGYYAGKLIADCGLKGCRISGAEVSVKHAGFIVNRAVGETTAADVRSLFEKVQAVVYSQFGVQLEPEVRFIGDWSGCDTQAATIAGEEHPWKS
jgi:UDP-N-acetylmuramate dehydrogenase